MSRRKLRKILEAENLPHIIHAAVLHETTLGTHFGNTRPITLELGCGTGQYTIDLARANPEKNFVGVDVKGARLWRGAMTAASEHLENVLFIRGNVREVAAALPPQSIDRIWITFPDPFPRKKQAKHRLTAPAFLESYQRLLLPAGTVQFKTDDPALYEYTLETVQAAHCFIVYHTADLYSEASLSPELAIQTVYEKRHLAAGKNICYIAWQFIPRTGEGSSDTPLLDDTN